MINPVLTALLAIPSEAKKISDALLSNSIARVSSGEKSYLVFTGHDPTTKAGGLQLQNSASQ
jgi:hypothetical protein